MLALNLNAYPKIKMYPDKSSYFTMRLIEAMAREYFKNAQIGFVVPWFQDLTEEQRIVKIRNRYSEPGVKRPHPVQKKWQGCE